MTPLAAPLNLKAQLDGRAARFAARLKGLPEPTFADLMRRANLEKAAQANRELVAQVLVLLNARHAIDAELSGRRLSVLAARIGEDLFDRVCECDLPDALLQSARHDLPRPDMLTAEGDALMEAAGQDPRLSNLAAIAIALVQDEAMMEQAA